MSDTKVVSIGDSPLSPKEKLDLYCEGLCSGENKTQAYIKAGFSSNHAQRNVAAYHRKHAEYITSYISEQIGAHVPTALKTVMTVLNDVNEKGGIRLKAAEMILDRGGFGAKQKLELTTKDVNDMSTQDLHDEFEKLFRENPDLGIILPFSKAGTGTAG